MNSSFHEFIKLLKKDINMGRLFGTDGIRGVANEYPMTSEMAGNVGRAVAFLFKGDEKKSKIIIGKDTRISGDMLECALAAGICSMGVDAYLAGTLPTPGVAFMASSISAKAGIVVSASHNPYFDNGIKIFNGDGFKLSDAKEEEIERLVLTDKNDSLYSSIRENGRVFHLDDANRKYAAFLKGSLPKEYSLKGMKIIIDCSNGATYKVAPEIFANLGADVESIFVNPDGKNINASCGSQHPETLQKKVVANKADIGFAFDGDGDRLIAVDEKGNVITGDMILAICAKFMMKKQTLKNNAVVSTIMSNMGLGLALKDMGINHIITKVGDRYVMKKMVSSGAVLGGEDSGHLIFLNHHTTGDGILTALKLTEALKDESKPLSELGKIMTVFPQVLINVEVKNKPEIKTVPEIRDVIEAVETCLGEEGRVLVRYSGTQPLCRIMVEGPFIDETEKYCRQIADIVEEKLG